MTQTRFNLIGRRSDELAALHVAPLSRQLHQQLLRNACDVVLPVIEARRSLLVRASPIDALEGGIASVETKRGRRRLVNDSVLADRKLIGHDWRGHYSITSSARASTIGGTSRPRAFAVLRLITSSYLVGACTGRFAGFSPLRMRST